MDIPTADSFLPPRRKASYWLATHWRPGSSRGDSFVVMVSVRRLLFAEIVLARMSIAAKEFVCGFAAIFQRLHNQGTLPGN